MLKRTLLTCAAAALAACAATEQQEGPSEPAPEPPPMSAPAVTDQPMTWICEDDTRIVTRYLADSDRLMLTLAGRDLTLARIRRTPSAAWSDGEVTFGMDGGGAILRWEGEDVRCEREASEVGGDPESNGSARSPLASTPSHR